MSISILFGFSICNRYFIPHFLFGCHQGLQQQYNVQTLLIYMTLRAQFVRYLTNSILGITEHWFQTFQTMDLNINGLLHILSNLIFFSLSTIATETTITLCYPKQLDMTSEKQPGTFITLSIHDRKPQVVHLCYFQY